MGQAPSGGHTLQACLEVVCGLSQAHPRYTCIYLGWACQLDERDVIVDGVAVVIGVPENLTGSDMV